ncbi:MAG TPA: hypothetical protein VFQ53_04625 [Kofleriaceae bacterium]|nr:hypothetical protein [Kofleriaceae bacterium]
MSELAFNINGEAFDLPATATGWRVRRMRPRGAPEVVYGRDGVPLIVPAEAGLEELRQLVGAPGRYRLDAIDDRGRTIDKLPASYVLVPQTEHDTQVAVAEARAHDGGPNSLIAEAMRLNTELAKAVVERFPQMVQAAAELLRAADGAGLPARPPRVIDDVEDDENDGDDAAPTEATSGFDFNALIAQLMPLLVSGLASGNVKMPSLAAMLDWRKAAPSAKPANTDHAAKPAAHATKEPLGPAIDNRHDDEQPATGLPPIDPATMAHFVAVQAMLTPEESALAREVAAELKPAELRAWFDELSKLDVAEAAAKIRKVIGGAKGGAS